MKNNISLLVLLFICISINAQTYKFETVIDIETTDVISQGNTGTCWSFSTSSFLESEIIRLTGKKIDLSEMYTVRNTYPKKAWNYIMRQGKTQFSEGGLAHDVLNSVKDHGLVPSFVFTGLDEANTRHNHSEMITVLTGVLNTYVNDVKKPLSPKWKQVTESILDIYLGKNVETFNYEGIQYTPKSFLEMTKINPDDYVSLTSFSHEPYYTNFVLNIPDNFSNGSFYNITIEDAVKTVNNALKKGYTIALDCDVSESTFTANPGMAIIPEDSNVNLKELTEIVPEKEITQAYRQQEFENFNTTDDHLMHITGLVKDQNGNTYYKVKNSWGKNSERIANNGFIYMSEAYFKLKMISITLHKNVVDKKYHNILN
ncbi:MULTISPECIES: C1 family peptidase [unclassified Algibacter]|uniref:C1 family peptidase n=1 Tax=unclassified Algibacter TaxID=2615009 RepID=UPI00131DE0AE|nr:MULTISPECIES: C1 family peptidase [unclassified Algibacter]MCL5130242.1 C1 family peptidase [Algibacter sp. L4_22]